jgi:cystathionine gamma-synthase
LLRGLKTLALRMRAHCSGAAAVAQWLGKRSEVSAVHYPGLASDPGHDLATAQMNACGTPHYGGMVSIELATESRALRVCEHTRLFFLAESLGGVESLIEHPGRMTHASIEGSGVELPPALLRLSVGLEHPDDLIADLAHALEA